MVETNKQKRRNKKWAMVVAQKAIDCSGRCEDCGTTYGCRGHHKILRSNGGEDTYDNCEYLCPKCHFPKGYHKRGERPPVPKRVRNLK